MAMAEHYNVNGRLLLFVRRRTVILSAVVASRSEATAKSKDPLCPARHWKSSCVARPKHRIAELRLLNSYGSFDCISTFASECADSAQDDTGCVLFEIAASFALDTKRDQP